MAYDGVPGDREMELEEHLVELGKRLLVFFALLILLTLALFPFSAGIIKTLVSELLPKDIGIITLSPVEIVSTRIGLSMALAFALSSPIFIYEIFVFIRPGLFPSERKFFVNTVPSSAFLFIFGGAVAYKLFLKKLTLTLIAITHESATPVIVLSRFIKFVSFVVVSFGLVFQVPLIVYLLLKMELVEKSSLKENRKYAYALLFFAATVLSPEPTMASPIVITLIFIALFEASLYLFARGR